MQDLWRDCLVCGDSISSEVCVNCMQEQVEEWLSDRSPGYIRGLGRVKEFFNSYTGESAGCVICGQNVNVCSRCYCLAVHKALRGNSILASEFLDFAASRGFVLSSVKGVLKL